MRRGQHSAARKGIAKNIAITLIALVFLGGLIAALYPVVTGITHEVESHKAVEEFFHILPVDLPEHTEAPLQSDSADKPLPFPELLTAMQAYNERIYAEGQSGLIDAWSYTDPSFDLTDYGIADDVIGVLSIPSINLEMPIYLGATDDHMARGAAQLSQTSLPIGGENTNCVIAGHRGWRGAPYFLNLDKVSVGDEVTVINLWETLTYRVCEIRIIEPNDIEAILIQPGRDMLTLFTCHPYASGGRFRLVVYAERVTEESASS